MYNKIIFGIISVIMGIVMGLFFPIINYTNEKLQNAFINNVMNIVITLIGLIFAFTIYKLMQFENLKSTFVVVMIIVSVVIASVLEMVIKYKLYR